MNQAKRSCCWLLLWEWPEKPNKSAMDLTHLRDHPFAGTLPANYSIETVIKIVKPMIVSHVKMPPTIRAQKYGKKNIWHDPNDLGTNPDSMECKPRRIIHAPPIVHDASESFVCRYGGDHGVALRAAKVHSLTIRETEKGYEMIWKDAFDRAKSKFLNRDFFE